MGYGSNQTYYLSPITHYRDTSRSKVVADKCPTWISPNTKN